MYVTGYGTLYLFHGSGMKEEITFLVQTPEILYVL